MPSTITNKSEFGKLLQSAVSEVFSLLFLCCLIGIKCSLAFFIFSSISQVVYADTSTDKRSFYLSFTFQPHDWSEQAFEETHSFIEKNGDMIFHYFDDGVPWQEAFQGSEYHKNVESQLNHRIEYLNRRKKIAVGVNFLGKDRISLASYWGETDSLPLRGKWTSRSIDDPDVIKSYISYCRSMIERFSPDYFIFGMEVDSVVLNISSEEFEKLEYTISSVYTSLRNEYPNLPLILTFTLTPPDEMRSRLPMVRRLLQYTDVYAVSVYPYLFDGIAGDSANIPENLLSGVRTYIGNKPFAIAETGFNAKSWRLLRRLIWIPGSEESQAGYVNFLLRESEKLNAVFVNWWVPRDLDRLWEKMRQSGADPMLSQWNSNGLVDSQGKPRPSLENWRRWLGKPIFEGGAKRLTND